MMFLNKSSRKPDVVFHRSGRIDIKRRAARALGAKDGDVVNVCAEGGHYYLCITAHNAEDGCHSATCRISSPRGYALRAHSCSLSRALLSAMGCSEARIAVFTGDPEENPVFGRILPLFKIS